MSEEKKINEVKEDVEEEEVQDTDLSKMLFGEDGSRNMFQSLVYSVFNEGIDDNVLLFLRIVFGCLFLTLFALIFISHYNIHVFVLFGITALLCVSLEWWLREWDNENGDEEVEEEEEKKEEKEEEKKTK